MVAAVHLRKGNVVLYRGEPHRVMDFFHRTPGKGAAVVRLLLRNVLNGTSYEVRFNSQASLETATLEQRTTDYLYHDGNHYYFMDTTTYEQFALDREVVGDRHLYLKEGFQIQIEFFEGTPIGIQMPATVDLQVVETEPELKGATANNSPKPATLETGVTVQVPPFIRQGEVVRVDPNTGRYLERAR